MTPKEKAKELVNKFIPHVQWKLGQDEIIERAKRCALIAVDEILNEENDFIQTKWHYNYWEEVKNEINKL